eukprot:13321-Heterococcus_DN1.PRE.1
MSRTQLGLQLAHRITTNSLLHCSSQQKAQPRTRTSFTLYTLVKDCLQGQAHVHKKRAQSSHGQCDTCSHFVTRLEVVQADAAVACALLVVSVPAVCSRRGYRASMFCSHTLRVTVAPPLLLPSSPPVALMWAVTAVSRAFVSRRQLASTAETGGAVQCAQIHKKMRC